MPGVKTSEAETQSAGEFVRVGKVKDAHGIKGELFIILFAGEAAWLEDLRQLRLVRESGGTEPKILTIKTARLHKNGFIAKTNEILNRNDAEVLKGWLLEIPDEMLVSDDGEAIYLREIEGFRVFTQHKGEVGTISGFSSNGEQDLLIVHTSWGDFDVPFVEAFVVNIDFDAKTIHMDLPLGLLGELEDDEAK